MLHDDVMKANKALDLLLTKQVPMPETQKKWSTHGHQKAYKIKKLGILCTLWCAMPGTYSSHDSIVLEVLANNWKETHCKIDKLQWIYVLEAARNENIATSDSLSWDNKEINSTVNNTDRAVNWILHWNFQGRDVCCCYVRCVALAWITISLIWLTCLFSSFVI